MTSQIIQLPFVLLYLESVERKEKNYKNLNTSFQGASTFPNMIVLGRGVINFCFKGGERGWMEGIGHYI